MIRTDTFYGGDGLIHLESGESDYNYLETSATEDIWSSIEVYPDGWPPSLE